jgi:hypothetical protein
MHLTFRNGMACSIVATFVGVSLIVESTDARNHATHQMRISFIAQDHQTWFNIVLAGRQNSTKLRIKRELHAPILSLPATKFVSSYSIAVILANRFVMGENANLVLKKFQSNVAVEEHLRLLSATKVRLSHQNACEYAESNSIVVAMSVVNIAVLVRRKQLNVKPRSEKEDHFMKHPWLSTTILRPNIFALEFAIDHSNVGITLVLSSATKAPAIAVARLYSTKLAVTADEPFSNLRYHVVQGLHHAASNASGIKTAGILKSHTTVTWMTRTALNVRS